MGNSRGSHKKEILITSKVKQLSSEAEGDVHRYILKGLLQLFIH